MTIIFLKNTQHSCRGTKIILKLFELLSGLQINYNKSQLYVSKKDISNAKEWAEIIGCNIGTWPFSYLGVTWAVPLSQKDFGAL